MLVTKARAALAVAAGVYMMATPSHVSAQGATVCLRSGIQINAERFEARGETFSVYTTASRLPGEYPASAIVGINVPCGAASQPAQSPGRTVTSPGFGIHGSNTIGERLMPMLIEGFSQTRYGAPPEVRLGAPEEQELTLGGRIGPATSVQLHAHGSGTAAKGLASNAAEIGMSSRAVNDAEVQSLQAALKIDPREPGNEHILALDGLAVIVNPANPVRQLTLDQIARIFSGEIKSWSELGGANTPIKAHRRDDKSGTYDTFNALVLAPRKLKPGAEVKAHESSENLSDEVFRDAGGIGFIGLPYINRTRALSIADTCGLTSDPSTFTVKTETYPLARRLYLYTAGAPRNPVARDLLGFALSDDAQGIIKQAGFVEQSVELQSVDGQRQWLQALSTKADGFLPKDKELPAIGKDSLTAAAAGARRTSLTLRFDRGSAGLDTRARQDVARFARYLNSPAARGKRFFIVGFADSDGAWALNLRLSGQRASSVAQALQQAGIVVSPEQQISLSYQAPVACNDTDDGRRKNRRVEIWMAN